MDYALPDAVNTEATAINLLALVKSRLRYVDDLNWFDPSDLEFVELVERGTRHPVHVFRYTPTGRHLFLDERGRTYKFVPPNDPGKDGSFRLHHVNSNGLMELRPDMRNRWNPLSAPMEPYWSDPYEPESWDDYSDEARLRIVPNTPDDARSTTCYVTGVRREITQRELRNDSGEIMRGLDRGDEFVVTRNGVAVGELVPLRRHRFVSTDALTDQFRGAPTVDYARLRADLDAVAEQDPTPRA